MSISTITPKDLFSLLQKGEPAYLLDVRTQPEYDEVHAEGVKLVPVDQINLEQFRSINQNIYIFCRSGGRATRMAQKLQDAGIHNCIVVEGGTTAWEAEGLPVIKGTPKVLPLPRQVQITVGGITLLSALFGIFFYPLFLWIPVLTGGGLLFAGLTGTCGMATILSKCPWNRSSSCCSKKSCSSQ